MQVGYLIAAVIAVAVLFLALLTIGKFQQVKTVSVKIENATVNAEVADTPAKQLRGLMFRDSLPKDGGMLFTFGGDARHGIWMMNTSMPLDIIWLDVGKRVVHIEEGARPCDALAVCPVYYPESESRYVLEVESGYARGHEIKVGSVAKFELGEAA